MNITKIIVQLAFVGVAIMFLFMLKNSIQRPIEFQETREIREAAVQAKLKEIAELQKMHKTVTGVFAEDFDTLSYNLLNGEFVLERIFGDAYDTTQTVTRDTVVISGRDSIQNFLASKGKDISAEEYLKTIREVPFANMESDKDIDKYFMIEARDSTLVDGTQGENPLWQPSFEVATPIITYMHEYPLEEYGKYDPYYDPKKIRKVGDIERPNKTSGNW